MVSQEMIDHNDTDASMLAKLMCEVLPVDCLKEIARDAFTNSIADTMPLVKELARKTHNRYFKAAWLLWKYKVFVSNGLIILKRIDGYCSVNVNKTYIDLCIYKDIFGAIRTSNSSFLKSKKLPQS